MVARDGDHGADIGEIEQGAPNDLFRYWPRRGRVEQIPRDNREVDRLSVRESYELSEDVTMLGAAILASNTPTNMPIGRVQKSHRLGSR